MATPIIGDIIQSTVGKVFDRLSEKFLPSTLGENEKAQFRLEAIRLATEESRVAINGIQGARDLALKDSDGAPSWTKVLSVTHRPAWSFLTLAVFVWTVVAPYAGFPQVALGEVHKDIMQTVIIFYFGGRTIEKAAGIMRLS
ncbi:MAG: hypothetical protein AABY51_00915 [Deltaproteobacteria bacterium]